MQGPRALTAALVIQYIKCKRNETQTVELHIHVYMEANRT